MNNETPQPEQSQQPDPQKIDTLTGEPIPARPAAVDDSAAEPASKDAWKQYADGEGPYPHHLVG